MAAAIHEFIDRARAIFQRTQTHPPAVVTVWGDHSEKKSARKTSITSKSLYLSMSDHAGTLVDAPVQFRLADGRCLDLGHVSVEHSVTIAETEAALAKSGQEIRPRDFLPFKSKAGEGMLQRAMVSSRPSGWLRTIGAAWSGKSPGSGGRLSVRSLMARVNSRMACWPLVML